MRIGGRHGQITIFIIVGLLLVFIFYFVIKTTSDVQKNALSDAQETIFNKLFKKESLRLYRDDCLQDSLSDALILLGKQGGKLWAGDPGGTQGFQQAKNGIKYATPDGEFRVLYGITKEKKALTECNPGPCPDLYPCDTSEPTCTYTFPNTTVGFGNRPLLTKQIIEGEISSYLKAKVPECMQRIINTEINPSIKISDSTEDLTLQTLITDEGIKVEGEYPITMTLAGEEYFEISKIDLVYPTQLNKLLRTAITNPLKYDQKYIDFKFRQETLQEEKFPFASKEEDDALKPCEPTNLASYFTCFRALFQDDFQNLEINLESIESDNGDDIFIIRTPINNIVNNPEDAGAAGDMFEFYIARQNRPPALDYISRNACPGVYDYLVIPGSTDLGSDKTELGIVEITLNAKDPDEDADRVEEIKYFNGNDLIFDDGGEYKISIETDPPSNIPETLTVKAQDKHGLVDVQDVKFFVDEELTSSFTVKNLIDKLSSQTPGPSSPVIISLEDPFWVNLNPPSNVDERNIDQTATISIVYGNQEIVLQENIRVTPDGRAEEFGIPSPESGTGATIGDYMALLEPDLNLRLGPAVLKTSYTATYCPSDNAHTQETSAKVDVEVVQCLPYQNPAHLFPHPKHKLKFDSGRYVGEEEISPYQATHACCNNDNTFKASDEICFENPTPDCYGPILSVDNEIVIINPINPNAEGQLLLQEFATCTGNRGNVCGDKQYKFALDGDGKILCGGNSGSCNVPAVCAGKPAFTRTENTVCLGKNGCNLCNKAPVYRGGGAPPNYDELQDQLKTLNYNSNNFGCGCTDADVTAHHRCDPSFDGTFDGTCQNQGATPTCVGQGDPGP